MRSKRENILIALALLAVLYGAYALLLAPRGAAKTGTHGTGGDGELLQWLVPIQDLLKEANITPLQRVIVSRAMEPWPDDLILVAPLPEELMQDEERRLAAIRDAAENTEKERQRKLEDADRQRQSLLLLRKRFAYSGFAYVDEAKQGPLCAVINGVVYRQGEALEGTGHVVKSISRENVVIVSPEQAIEVTIPISK